MVSWIMKPVSSEVIKNDGSFIAAAGTEVDVDIISIMTLAVPSKISYNLVNNSVHGVLNSGVVTGPINSGISWLTTVIGGTANTALGLGATKSVYKGGFYGYQRLNITSMSASGTPTFGAGRGVTVLASGMAGGALGKTADRGRTVQYMTYMLNGASGLSAVI